MRRLLSTITAVLLSIAVTGCTGDGMQWHARDVSALMPELAFELVDEAGNKVHAQTWEGKVVLLFFGFTHCPDYCPTTLARLGQALDRLPERLRNDVRILFVSVDPERDTLEDLRVYTDNFAPEVVGLTGGEAALRELAKRYRTTFSHGKPDEQGNYAVSHGRAVYAFDRQGNARLMILGEQSVDQIAADLRQLIDAPGGGTA